MRLGPGGQLVMEVLPRFASLTSCAERIFDSYFGNGTSPTFRECWDACCEALGVNYRLGPWEISSLELVLSDRLAGVMQAMVDVPSINAELAGKKKGDTAPVGDGGDFGKAAI
jgi:hypothetical protein